MVNRYLSRKEVEELEKLQEICGKGYWKLWLTYSAIAAIVFITHFVIDNKESRLLTMVVIIPLFLLNVVQYAERKRNELKDAIQEGYRNKMNLLIGKKPTRKKIEKLIIEHTIKSYRNEVILGFSAGLIAITIPLYSIAGAAEMWIIPPVLGFAISGMIFFITYEVISAQRKRNERFINFLSTELEQLNKK